MNTQKKILLIVILVIVVGAIVWLEVIKPNNGPTQTVQQEIANETSTAGIATTSSTASSTITNATSPAQFLATRASTIQQEIAAGDQAAPEITDPTGWINTQPFTLASLVGNKVVLVDFWTYSCINCIRTIPYVNAWYAKYKNAGLEIVGIHTPEFQFEHDITNVQNAVKQLGIQYPVVLDSNMGTWDAYQNLYWPAEYLINIDGFIVHNSIGEGNYNETETAIQQALIQRDEALGIPTSTVPTGFVNPTSTITINYNGVQSPETYFGAERNQYLANGPEMTNGTYTLTAPAGTTATAIPQANSLYLSGNWDFEDQYATNLSAPAKIFYEYDSKNVYMVAASDNPSKPVTVQVWVDGTQTGTVTIQANQLYNIVQGSSYGVHDLELVVENPGLDAYTFTFG